MKRAIFFAIRKKAVTAALSGLLFAVGAVTPVRWLFNPAIAIAEDKGGTPPARVVEIVLTAYSSSPEETDDTPFITASGETAADGVIANNCLPFGTKVKIPEVFGDKVFVVEDRKHSRYSCEWLDVWYPTKAEAQNFGIKRGMEAVIL